MAFVLLGIPYVNLRKNVADWTRVRAVPEVMYGIPAWLWFELAAAVVAAGLAVLILRHMRRPLAVVPTSLLGQGQGLYLVLLAIMVIGNFERAVVSFAPQRLVTEGVIHCTALLCAVTLLVSDGPASVKTKRGDCRNQAVGGVEQAGADRTDCGPAGDPRRLGHRADHLRRPVRGSRWPAHPVRSQRDDSRFQVTWFRMNMGRQSRPGGMLAKVQDPLQFTGKLQGRLMAVFGFASHRLHDDLLQFGGKIRVEVPGSSWLCLGEKTGEQARVQFDRCVERPGQGEGLEERHPHGVKVAEHLVGPGPEQPFRGHVHGRPRAVAHLLDGRKFEIAAQSQIAEIDAGSRMAIKQNVRRFDVSMNNSRGVNTSQGACRGRHDAAGQ